MAEKLMRYYKYVADEKGLNAKIILAQRTKIPSTQAAMEPDNAENLKLFMDVVKEITGKPAPKY